MKQNKESLRASMDRRLSFLDELPSCRAAVQQRIAQEEEPEMKRKISLGFVIAMALVLVSVAAVAAGLLLSPRVSATQAAEKALLDKYGVTAEMQTFFGRTENELEDGTVEVKFLGLVYPLGTYTAIVKDGKAEISWSNDGKDTAGGYDAEAWGAEQLKEMMKDSLNENSKAAYLEKGEAIAEKTAEPIPEEEPVEDVWSMFFYQLEKDKQAALDARKLTEEEMYEIGKQFIINSYGLNEEQIGKLELYTTSSEESGTHFYGMVNGKPCCLVEYLLYQVEYTNEMVEAGEPWPYTEKDGYYQVFINVEDGTVEQYEYNSTLGGVG